jgi:hypothetical protein
MRDEDLRDELQFHIDMRAQRHVNAGMSPADAEALARKQFGDMEVAMKGMRQARTRSPRVVLAALTLTSLSIAGLWLFTVMASTAPVALPPLPRAPLQLEVQKRPPPPPRGPTWDEFVAKVNTFGDGDRAKTPRR